MNFSFLRKPLQIILYAVIFCILSTIALTFVIQYKLDGVAIDEAIKRYTYVGTVYSNYELLPFLKSVPQDIVKSISESEHVDYAECRTTYLGRTDKVDSLVDYFMTKDTLEMYVVLEGRIAGESTYSSYDNIEEAPMIVNKIWAGVQTNMSRITVFVKRDDLKEGESYRASLKKNDRVLVVGRIPFDVVGNSMNFTKVYTGYQSNGYPNTALENTQILHIPEDCSREGTDSLIRAYLEEQGLTQTVEKINACRNTFNIKPVADMSLLLGFAQNSCFITYGRAITRADIGKKVCVVNQFITIRNNLKVGDKIKISVVKDNYDTKQVLYGDKWEVAYPTFEDELFEYGEYEEYEIVGVYNFFYRDVNEDVTKFSRDDIFIPIENELGLDSFEEVTPYAFSFRVLGPEYENFLDDFEMQLAKRGYVLKMIDTGWDDFADSYKAMLGRRMISLASAILIFIAAIALFIVLTIKRFGYEFGLRRLIGAKMKEAVEAFISPYIVLGIPALILAVAVTSIVYDKWLVVRMADILDSTLPGTSECIQYLAVWASGEFVLGLIALTIVSLCNGRRKLLGMVK